MKLNETTVLEMPHREAWIRIAQMRKNVYPDYVFLDKDDAVKMAKAILVQAKTKEEKPTNPAIPSEAAWRGMSARERNRLFENSPEVYEACRDKYGF